MGRSLLLPFDIQVLDPSGLCALIYKPKTECCKSSTQSHETEAAAHVHGFTDILMQLLGNEAVVDDHESDEEPPA